MLKIGSEPEVVLDCRNNLGESILWDDSTQKLRWVDIHAGNMWSWCPYSDDAPTSISLNDRIGAIALRGDGGVVAALSKSFALVDLATNEICEVAVLADCPASVRFNDGRVDPAGRFICGGMDEASPQRPIAAVYSLDRAFALRRLINDVSCTNSLCWSPSGTTMYFTDMPERKIVAFDYDLVTGVASNRRLFADLATEPGLADGSITDADGFLWNAQWGGGKIVRYTPDGRVDREILLPVSNPTCLTFGGADLDVLFITTAWFGLDPAARLREPSAGSIFALRPGVRGCTETRFSGQL